MIRRGLEILTERAVPVVFVEEPPQYYARFGFEAGAGQSFRKPSLRIPDAAFQALRLPSYEPWMTGTLVYSDTFWRHDAVGAPRRKRMSYAKRPARSACRNACSRAVPSPAPTTRKPPVRGLSQWAVNGRRGS
jgi:hypothetical protein